MASWWSEGTAHRTPVQRTPIRHILVDQGGEWRMWCSYGLGRQDNPHGNRRCGKCRELVRDAVADETMDADEVADWL